MSKRLQVLLEPSEYKAFQHISRGLGLSLGEWVRVSLRKSSQEFSPKGVDRKLTAIREASRFSFPSGEMDQMNAEIERGYLS